MANKTVYALDFDGVICDSAVETAITGWKAATRLWDDMPNAIPENLIDQFRLVRPIIETGYEAILVMRLLYQGETVAAIYDDHNNQFQHLLKDNQLTVAHLKALFGQIRDTWIAEDVSDWIHMNPLFDGIAEKLRALGQLCPWYVVTTKQERFVKQILNANSIDLSDERIFGLDRNMSKVEVLLGLSKVHADETIVFVEDRLPTLLNVMKNDGLADVNLVFALWGYNSEEDKRLAEQQTFELKTLEDFLL